MDKDLIKIKIAEIKLHLDAILIDYNEADKTLCNFSAINYALKVIKRAMKEYYFE